MLNQLRAWPKLVPNDTILFFYERITVVKIKYIFLIVASCWMAACSAHDERYYRLHPNALQKAITACPQKQPANVTCEQLRTIASRVNELAYQLRLNPQGYGKEILALQEAIAKQEANSGQANTQPTLAENKRELEEHLAIVKWLESPER